MLCLQLLLRIGIRAYLIEYPSDKSAFQSFVDRFTSEASSTTYSMVESPEEIQEVDNFIRQKLAQNKSI